MKRILHSIADASVMILLCVTAHASGADQAARSKLAVTVTNADAGKTVQLAAGGSLFVRLASNPTTGYQWQEAKSGGIHLQQVGKPRYEKPADAALGAGGNQIFKYKAVRPGKVTLMFRYVRPWERSPIKSYAITVLITR